MLEKQLLLANSGQADIRGNWHGWRSSVPSSVMGLMVETGLRGGASLGTHGAGAAAMSISGPDRLLFPAPPSTRPKGGDQSLLTVG